MSPDQNLVQMLTQLTFVTTTLAMGAAAIFFYAEKEHVQPRYRLALTIEALICGIACLMYNYMRTKYVPGTDFPTSYRYIDWLITTPMLLLEFTALLNFKNPAKAMATLVFWDVLMILAGWLGETYGYAIGGFQMRWVMFTVSCGGWLGVLVYLYTNVTQLAKLSDKDTKRCIVVLSRFVTLGWLIYPMGYVVRALAPQYGDSCQLVYNIGDIVNKIGFGLIVWAAAVASVKGVEPFRPASARESVGGKLA